MKSGTAERLTFGGRLRRLVPFFAVTLAAFPLTFIGGTADAQIQQVKLAFALFILTALILIAFQWKLLPPICRLLVVVLYCGGVAMLRDAGGPLKAGYGILLLLPVVWVAVYGRRVDVLSALVMVSLTLGAPIVVVGPPEYPVPEWRLMVLYTAAFTLTGLVVNRLVLRSATRQRLFATVVDVSRRLAIEDLGASIGPAIQNATGAEIATYAEIDDDLLVHLPPDADGRPTRPVTLDEMAPGFRNAVRDAKVTMSLAGTVAPGPWCDLPNVTTVVHQPVILSGNVVGVISMGWARSIRKLDDEVTQVVDMLAAEAAVAAERQRMVRQLEQMANRDQLTGVLNRRAWDSALAMELSRRRRTGLPATICLLDLDKFKAYNDRYGHPAGDELLVRATAAWTAQLRDIDILARWGGEEFVILLPATSLDDAEVAISRLRACTPGGQTFSCGLVAVEGLDPAALLRAADDALYAAKAAGRNCTARGEVVPDHSGALPLVD